MPNSVKCTDCYDSYKVSCGSKGPGTLKCGSRTQWAARNSETVKELFMQIFFIGTPNGSFVPINPSRERNCGVFLDKRSIPLDV